ncbi:MAG: TldD/PmbA family protein [Oscillospiraceae bacterium]|nr:TldD/PmbA family protein [Oscillospiraceae bacterium]
MKNNKELYDAAEYAHKRLKEKGADGAEISVNCGAMDELNFDAGKFSLMRTTFSSGISIRALCNSRKGSYGTNKIDRETVDKAVDAAIGAAKSSEPDSAEVISEGIGEHVFDLKQTGSDPDLMYDRMAECIEQIKQQYPKTDVMQFIVSHNAWDSLYTNSNGTRVLNIASQYGARVSFSARDGDKTTSFNGSGYTAKDLSVPILDYSDEMRRLIAGSTMELDAAPVAGKFTGTLLCPPGSTGHFVGSALGSCTGSGAIIAGTSPWKDKIGEIVADEAISVSFDPLDARMINAWRLQDGYLAKKQEIIQKGKLAAFSLGEYAALKTGLPRASATGYTVIAPGKSSVEQLTANIERGILINRFSGGAMAPNGDFSGVAKNSFLIEDGKIAGAISETMVSGNMLEMLFDVAGVSSEVSSCGGGSVIPWAAFGGVVISGK